ncbi:lysylphosphatidylglycerol synthase transmembrane domain-containing protein [Nocardioides panaciterrulae]|uniref:Uncharacterized membrane protein YbhN (UPF0104 family) n=1 Tax=Nocardioides panaciterrulae TaxID=661492 RepID=A0A7Y9J9R9_9ACTN|nr:YbhN family protein [Nocardioides panaciterrulae]NYD40912.1 uncharacterized membrane protein YbhN (UPF0104 family) [Nocardioides panaciterrulae]
MSTVTSLRFAGRAALVAGVAGAGLWAATHGIAGVGWSAVLAVLGGVSWHWLAVLAVVWLGGLGIYSLVLAASLPGLGLRRSLLLNLSGSAVANVVPLGGAVATAMNWRMVRSWGHSNGAFAAYCVLTNLLDVLVKLLLPLLAVLGLVALSQQVPPLLWVLAGAGAGAVVLAGVAWAVLRRVGPERAGRLGGRAQALREGLRDTTVQIVGLVRRGWARLLPASVAYVAAQVALLWCALHAVGLGPGLAVVVTAAAVERLGTLVPITPGGTGIAEAGTIAWLVAAGLDPGRAVAGVLLYRVFLIAMEVPVGGALLGAWALLQRVAAPARREALS